MLQLELDHLETLGRKNGLLFIRKGYHRQRDLINPLLDSLDRKVLLISVGRKLSTLEELDHFNLRSVIRVNGNEPSGLLNWTEDLELFQYVTPSLYKAIELSMELTHRGDIVLFSPYGSKEDVLDWFSLFDKNLKKFGIE